MLARSSTAAAFAPPRLGKDFRVGVEYFSGVYGDLLKSEQFKTCVATSQ